MDGGCILAACICCGTKNKAIDPGCAVTLLQGLQHVHYFQVFVLVGNVTQDGLEMLIGSLHVARIVQVTQPVVLNGTQAKFVGGATLLRRLERTS